MQPNAEITYLPVPPEVEALQFHRLIEIYTELGLTDPQAAAAAQADYLCGNYLAFRTRSGADVSWFLLDCRGEAA